MAMAMWNTPLHGVRESCHIMVEIIIKRIRPESGELLSVSNILFRNDRRQGAYLKRGYSKDILKNKFHKASLFNPDELLDTKN